MRSLHQLSKAAGIEINWCDINGIYHTISDNSLIRILAAIGFPANTDEECQESLHRLAGEEADQLPPLITTSIGRPTPIPLNVERYQITLENGDTIEGDMVVEQDGVSIPPIHELGYHQLRCGDRTTIIAVAPKRAFTIEDAAGDGKKLWGLTVQLYSLRRTNDGGIGDFEALADLAGRAATAGAAAIGISPVHALFSADVTRYGPYAPSNRAALNIFHIAQESPELGDDTLINWPHAAENKLQLLRKAFKTAAKENDFKTFRASAGIALERHAIFEALATKFTKIHPFAQDWRQWPIEFQHPDNPEVIQFSIENHDEIEFHVWLQFKADQGLATAHAVARQYGAKIGLITDLAVGTDTSGSHSWVRQGEVLQGLEIGAPPDLLNREGQKWGITAFSPRGLRRSGYSGFIEMLRHTLRHAGGVRVDHIMGLARLWVIPSGALSTEGAYLSMPVDDLLRIVCLESHRHKAVILGEDLGTLPEGFGDKLNNAGIAGLRVLWFERHGRSFVPPDHWTRTAVAMTTTHDLPTLAGWWQGRDIEWRQALNLQGDSPAERDEDRIELWSAFQKSRATSEAMPSKYNIRTLTMAAVSHLANAAGTLALLPIEDALSLVEQPNLPGTAEEHPNWRRRLPGDAEQIFSDPDFICRLAILNASRPGKT